MPIKENVDPTEPHLPEVMPGAPSDMLPDEADTTPDTGLGMDDAAVLAYLGEARRVARNYQQIAAINNWEQSEAAYRSEHHSGSKYLKDQYKNRARYFKPKTRAAVMKSIAATARALFTSNDVMTCEADDDSNPLQRANAALIKEVITARFSNKTRKMGVPWFQIALGARMDAQKLGACCSKQDWSYKVRERVERRPVERPVLGRDGQPVIAFPTGQPMTETVVVETIVQDVVIDKPTITLFPAEMVLLDPVTNWIDPAQESPTLQIIYPMHADDVRQMMEDEGKSNVPWRKVTDEELRAAFYSENELSGIKVAREGDAGATSTTATQRGPGKFGGLSTEVVEAIENFFRIDGEDYHCWTLKGKVLLSDPVPVMDAYPAHRGIRPIVIGTDVLEPHVLYKESAVKSWQPAQSELNDFANIRMDATRQATYPAAKVKAGQGIDYKAVQRRDTTSVILVKDPNDVVWDRPPAPPGQLYQEGNLLGNDIDELAGNFSQNSVQSNRQLNETVGGMQLIAANAGSTSELALQMFIDSWVEPVLSQIVMLEQYYEDDMTLLAVSGQKAKLFQKFGVSEINDELLESQITLRLNVGMGSADPMMDIAKFKTMMELSMPFVQMMKAEGKGDLDYEGILGEIWGKGGYKSGADRFIKLNDGKQGPQIPPQAVKAMMAALQEAKQQIAQLKGDRSVDMGKLKIDDDKNKIEAAKVANEARAQQSDQQLQRDQMLMQSGFPPGYSHQAETAASQARLEAMLQQIGASRQDIAQLMAAMAQRGQATDETIARLVMAMGAQTNTLAASLDRNTQAQMAPKHIINDANGRPAGVAIGMPQ